MGWNLQLGSRRIAPLKLLTLFALLSGIPLLALGWLGWRVLQQDRALESQRVRERLDNAAALIARELDRTLSAWETVLPAAADGQAVTLPAGGVFVLIAPDGVVGHQGVRLPYYPRVAASISADASLFAAAEHYEFREQNLAAAIAAYRTLAAAPDPSTRGGALLRLARCLRKQGRTADALAAYADLASLPLVSVAGSPAELVARRERVALFESAGDSAAATRERALLSSRLIEGRFLIDRVTFDYFLGAVSAPPTVSSTTVLAQAVEGMWPAWQEQAAGRVALTNDHGTVVATWRKTPKGIAAITASLDALTASVGDTLRSLQVAARLDDQAGESIWGTAAGAGVTRSARETGLPWSLLVTSTDPVTFVDSRRNLFIGGFALMSLVVFAASYVAFRAVTRELAVARLQSDFVAAVSHEFRTPWTAMCHLTEILEQGDAPPERRPQYYQALGKESRRLRTMVESLLDFGRMDSGQRSYDFCATDAVELVDQVVQEFSGRSSSAARRIDTSSVVASGSAVCVHADREALALALRNLLDNAIKYSPESAPVRLAVTAGDGTVAVSIEDRGPGVSAEERRSIFQKFTRGTAARSLNVKGTGIGLTMAHQIVKAHGGRLELDSELGRGSVFTMVLPVMPQ